MSRNQDYEKVDEDKPRHPLSSANFFSVVAFLWMNSLFKAGSRRPLEESAIFPVHEDDKTRDLTEKLQEQWNTEITRCRNTGKRAKLWKSVLKAIPLKQYCFYWFVSLSYSTGRIIQPLLLGTLKEQLMSPDRDRGLAFVVAALLPFCGLIAAFSHCLTYKFEMAGVRICSAIKGIVFLKVRPTCMALLL